VEAFWLDAPLLLKGRVESWNESLKTPEVSVPFQQRRRETRGLGRIGTWGRSRGFGIIIRH
jgi:hypothetical protein